MRKARLDMVEVAATAASCTPLRAGVGLSIWGSLIVDSLLIVEW
jgi:hypothetical protein